MNGFDQARAIRSRWPVVAAVVVLGLFATWLFGRAPTRYTASHVLLFQETSPSGPISRDAYGHDLEAAAALARSQQVATIAKPILNATNTVADLATKVTAVPDVQGNTITLKTVPETSRALAKALVDVFAGTVQGFVNGRSEAESAKAPPPSQKVTEVEAAIKALNPRAPNFAPQRDALLKQYADAVAAAARGPSAVPSQSLTSLAPALTEKVTKSHVAPDTILGWMPFAGALGFLGGALALVTERFDRRIRRRRDAEVAFRLPVLAEIPPLQPGMANGQAVVASQPRSGPANAYRNLRAVLLAGNSGTDVSSVLVTSAGPDEGATTTAVNLAASVAETGKSVLLIDCNLHTPDAHRHLGVAEGPGLSDVLSGGAATLDQVAVATSIPGVRLVPAGGAVDNPASLLAQRRNLVSLGRMVADFVVLDAPALNLHEAADLSWMVDAVLVSCRAGGTSSAAATRAGEVLDQLDAPPTGVVLLDSDDTSDQHAPVAARGIWRPDRLVATTLRGGTPGPLSPPARPAPAPAEPKPTVVHAPSRRVVSWGGTIALMVVLWFAIRAFLFLSFYIPSPSMDPALKPGDRVLVSKLSYRLHDINRGDIVVFKRPPHIQAAPDVHDLVKRVIGLPGDTVEARNGHVFVNGRQLVESYVKNQLTTDFAALKIPAGRYWVMGDNRVVSEDSRYFGAIPQRLVVGRVFFQVWPVSHLGFL